MRNLRRIALLMTLTMTAAGACACGSSSGSSTSPASSSSAATSSAATWDLLPGVVLVGAGVGTVLGQIIQFVLAGVSMDEVGSASGVMEASQQLSTSLGVAVLGTIFFTAFKHHVATDALRITSWVCLIPLAAAFALVFLLPKHARTDAGH